jgi:hypothetical protein
MRCKESLDRQIVRMHEGVRKKAAYLQHQQQTTCKVCAYLALLR